MEKAQNHYTYETSLSYLSFDENGFLISRFKDVPRTLEKQKASFAMIRNITGGKRVCAIVDMRDCRMLLFDEKLREYMMEVGPSMFKALAFVVSTTLQKVSPTIFVNTMGQPIPMNMFEDEIAAAEWLKQFDL